MKSKLVEKVLKWMIIGFPAVLYLSYYPIISFGANETMNFELSVPLIFLVVFDVVACAVLARRKMLIKLVREKWAWWLFPIFVTCSILWTLNLPRAVLTCGVMWLIYFAVMAMVGLKDVLVDEKMRIWWMKIFIGATAAVCLWCLVQCVLDVVGVPREQTLLCAGCVSAMFGFPHPSGFAIEPQFMGNLLLAPTLVMAWLVIDDKNLVRYKKCWLVAWLVVFAGTLFLTFSRGAIYAFGIAMVFMIALVIVREKKKRGEVLKKCGMVCGVVAGVFLLVLNVQGILAEVSPTNDTYQSGIAKVLNHLSLGIIDVREKNDDAETRESTQNMNIDDVPDDFVAADSGDNEAIFDGYVEESTETRVRLTNAAFEIWRKDFKTIMVGVGIGGAGQALYDNGLSPAPKEIVQNEYASLLLETGLVGTALFVLTVVMIVKVFIKSGVSSLLLTVMVAYMVTLFFFSGLANALQIYLMPAILMVIFDSACGKIKVSK